MKKRTLLLLSMGAILVTSGISYFNPMFYIRDENIELLQPRNRTSMNDILTSEQLDNRNVLISFWSLDSQRCLFESEIKDKCLLNNCEPLHLIEVNDLFERNEALKLIKNKNLRGNYLLMPVETYTKLLFELRSSTEEVGLTGTYPIQYFVQPNQQLADLHE